MATQTAPATTHPRKTPNAQQSPAGQQPVGAQQPDAQQQMEARNKQVVRAGLVGIVANVLLSSAKLLIGLVANSLAIILDGVNNLADAGASIITIVGVKLGARRADREHPMGYGRVEYLSALAVAVIVLATGIVSFRDSIEKILHPVISDYSWVAVVVIVIAIAVKLWLGIWTKKQGKETDSDALVASGVDSYFDAVVSATTLLAIATAVFWHVSIDGWVSAFISLVVAKAGWDMMSDVVNEILGERIDPRLAKELKTEIAAFPGVLGVHDLYLDAYGPNEMIGSVHLALEADTTAAQIDMLSRQITAQVYREHHILLTCGVYGIVSKDPEYQQLFKSVRDQVATYPGATSMHAFFVDPDTGEVRFDVVRSFDVKDPGPWRDELEKELAEKHPGHTFKIAIDVDYAS